MMTTHPSSGLPVAEQNALYKQYCVTCHNDRAKAGGLTLASFDAGAASEHSEVAEKVIRKLRAGMMPPAGARRPEATVLGDLASALEMRIDQAAALHPNPGRRPFQRLNRAEYTYAIRDLLDLELDVEAYLPPDTISDGFDNVADAQGFSPTVLEGYLRAASAISTLAVGDANAAPTEAAYKVPRTASQMRHVEGAPFGTRGGIAVTHIFPADGEYTFRMLLHSIPTGQLFGSSFPGEKIEVSINGARVALIDINTSMSESDPNGMNLVTPKIYVKAGPQRVAAAFIARFDAPVDDLIAPIEHTMADSQIGSGFGITALPHLREFAITGPVKVMGVSDSPSRRRIFTCRPTAPSEEVACATSIVKHLASLAYRGPVSSEDVRKLMAFYDQGRQQGDFEEGVRMSLQALLASPKFLFRLEVVPAGVRPGQNYRITDDDLASRMSFFIWGSGPDQELLKLAGQGTLRQPAVLDRQVRRMLADPRSEALATRFASQWLRLQDLVKLSPDYLQYPQYDRTLADALKRETELLFDAIVHNDRSVLETAHRRLHLRQRAVGQALRGAERDGGRVPQGGPHGPEPPRPAGAGQHPGPHLGGRPHLAGAARQVDHGGAARLAAAGAAAQRAVAGRLGVRGAGRQGPVGARAHGGAPQEPRVQLVPPRDRPAGPGPRELRRDRRVADPRRRLDHRFERRPVRRHGPMAWAGASSTSTCPRSAASSATRRRRTTGFRSSCWGWSRARRSRWAAPRRQKPRKSDRRDRIPHTGHRTPDTGYRN
jgi:hypothetical protein